MQQKLAIHTRCVASRSITTAFRPCSHLAVPVRMAASLADQWRTLHFLVHNWPPPMSARHWHGIWLRWSCTSINCESGDNKGLWFGNMFFFFEHSDFCNWYDISYRSPPPKKELGILRNPCPILKISGFLQKAVKPALQGFCQRGKRS